MGYRADIDGLRAVAIVLVVAFHVGLPGLDGGFVGVDVFFVLSGYLITRLLWSELGDTGRISWANFYARRARRLLPALCVVVLATLVIGVFVLVPDPELRWLAQSVVAVAASVSNMLFFWRTSDYFGADAELMPLLNTWSLAVEEQFYLVWPVVLAVGGWLVTRSRRWGRHLVVGLLAGIGAGSFVLAVVLVQVDQAAAFYWMPPRLWELAAGGALAIGARRLPALGAAAATSLAVTGLVLVLGSAVLLDPTSAFPGVAAVPVVAGTVLLIVAGSSGSQNPVSLLLGRRPIVVVGLLSYSWYLIHWPLLVFARTVTLESSLVRDALIAAGALGLAALSFRFVEQPFRATAHRRVAGARPTLLVGAASLLVLAGVGLVTLRDAESWSRLEMPESAAEALRENRTVADTCPMNPTGGSDPVDCVVGGPTDTSLVLVGDSHALALLPAAEAAAAELGWQLEVLWDTACPYLTRYRSPDGLRRLGGDCERENEVRHEYLLAEADRIGAVVTTGRSTSAVLRETPSATAAVADAWQDSLTMTLGELTGAGIPVLVVNDVPHFDLDVPECVVRRGDDCDVEVARARAFRQPVADAETAAVGRSEGVVDVWDPFDVLCDDSTCRATDGPTVLYRDRTHLSSAGARYVADDLAAALDGLLDGSGGQR